MFVRFEEGSDVQCLAAPEVTLDGPVEGKLQGTLVEVPGNAISSCTGSQWVLQLLTEREVVWQTSWTGRASEAVCWSLTSTAVLFASRTPPQSNTQWL